MSERWPRLTPRHLLDVYHVSLGSHPTVTSTTILILHHRCRHAHHREQGGSESARQDDQEGGVRVDMRGRGPLIPGCEHSMLAFTSI